MRLLLTNLEQEQPADSKTVFKLYGRDEDAEAHDVTVHGFRPYFYAPADEVQFLGETYLLEQESIEELSGGYEALDGTELVRIYTPMPQDTREARELFDNHYEADVPFVRRFLIDTGIEDVFEAPSEECHWRELTPVEADPTGADPGGSVFETVSPRVCTVDIEVDDSRGFPQPGERRILSIVAHDSYTDETVAWIDLDGTAIEDTTLQRFAKGDEKPVDEILVEPTERRMLINFACWIDDHDPDILTGWNFDDFDMPHILERMDQVGASATRMARGSWAGVSRRGDARVKGRTVYDLLTLYDANRSTELQSKKLDAIAEKELGAEKLKHGYEQVKDLYDEDPAELLRYNARDVDLTVGINERDGTISFRDTLRRQVGLRFEDAYMAKDIVDMLCRRKLKEWGVAGPSRPDYEDRPDFDYEGAVVFDPYEGLARNVGAIDVASQYPNTISMLNASPDTMVDEDYGGPTTVAANGQHFALDKRGLFPSIVDDAMEIKEIYRAERNEATNEDEYKRLNERYEGAKRLATAMYGVNAWSGFFLFDVKVAEATTLTAQEVIRTAKDYVEERGFNAIYGDTDSLYIEFGEGADSHICIEEMHIICEELNESVYPDLAEQHGVPAKDNLWSIDPEAFMETFFQAGKKKRYAYLAIWREGNWIDDPKPSITGFEVKRSDAAQVTNDVQQEVLSAILYGEDGRVPDIIYEHAQKVTGDEPDWEYIGIPGGLGQRIDPEHAGEDGYYAFSDGGYPQDAHPRGCWNSNHLLGTRFGSGDKPMRAYLLPRYFEELGREIDVICYDEREDLEPIIDDIELDTARMLATTVTNPIRRIVGVLGVDVDATVKGQKQTGLGAF